MSLLQYLLETPFQFSSLHNLNCTSSSVVLLYLYTINSCWLTSDFWKQLCFRKFKWMNLYILPRSHQKPRKLLCNQRISFCTYFSHLCSIFVCLCACVLFQQLTSSGFSFMTSDKDGEKWSRMWRMMKGRRCLRRQMKQ